MKFSLYLLFRLQVVNAKTRYSNKLAKTKAPELITLTQVRLRFETRPRTLMVDSQAIVLANEMR